MFPEGKRHGETAALETFSKSPDRMCVWMFGCRTGVLKFRCYKIPHLNVMLMFLVYKICTLVGTEFKNSNHIEE